MTSSENPSKKSVEDELMEVINSIDNIKEKLGQYVYQRLMTKQLESLRVDLTNVKVTLSEVKVRLRPGSRDSSADERERFSTLTSGIDSSLDGTEYYKEHSNGQVELIEKLRSENHRLQEEIKELEQESKWLRDHYNEKLIDSSFTTHNSSGVDNNCSLDFPQAVQELNRCKEALKAMKADRRQLKSDNLDLHMQMKQLYCTLGDKEAELRDFIRNYDQRKQDHLDTVRKLKEEKERVESEKRELVRRTKEAVEQNLTLKSQLEVKETKLFKLQQEFLKLLPVQRSSTLNSVKSSLSQDSLIRGFSSASFNPYDTSGVKPPTVGSAYSSYGLATEGVYARCSDDHGAANDVYAYHHMEASPAIPRTASITEGQLQSSREKALRVARMSRYRQSSTNRINTGMFPSSSGTLPSGGGKMTKLGIKFQSTSTIDEVESQSNSPPPVPPASSRLSFLSQENYEEKLKAAQEAQEIPVAQWRAHHVLAWIELRMNMGAFGPACSDNIKSGKILLGLSDSELESALRLSSSLHRRKMRLAIEELRDPSSIQYPNTSGIDHMWVSHEWIYSLGLPQHSQAFENQLVDGRLLQVLTKKDLDKHLGVHRKFHQSSIQFAIDLLRILDFDKQVLQERRNQSRQSNSDPLVWSNQQILLWAERIDLQEYAQNLKESGIHGAVLVLDTSFTADTLASILGIPSSKSYVRRHLATELDSIVKPARSALESVRTVKRSNSSTFTRSFSPANHRSESEGRENSRSTGTTRKLSFRGSIGKAFGRKAIRDSSSGGDNRDTSRQEYSSNTETSNHSNSSDV